MKNLFAVAALIFAFCAPTVCLAGPFGFHYGETQAEVIQAVGASHVRQGNALYGELKLDRAPQPHSEFESYHLFFSPTKGMVKIFAIGVDIDTDGSGTELREHYTKFQTALTSTYGVMQSADNLVSGSIWTDPGNWTMSIIEKDRTVDSLWSTDTTSKDHIADVVLELEVTNQHKGYLTLSYEYEGWGEFVDSVNLKKNSVL